MKFGLTDSVLATINFSVMFVGVMTPVCTLSRAGGHENALR